MVSPFKIAAFVLTAAALASGPARAQYYSSAPQRPPPLYPYVQQRASQPYAVEVAPGTYVIRRPGEARAPVHRQRAHRAAPAAPRGKNNPRLIGELRQRAAAPKTGAIDTTKVVRLKPKVVE